MDTNPLSTDLTRDSSDGRYGSWSTSGRRLAYGRTGSQTSRHFILIPTMEESPTTSNLSNVYLVRILPLTKRQCRLNVDPPSFILTPDCKSNPCHPAEASRYSTNDSLTVHGRCHSMSSSVKDQCQPGPSIFCIVRIKYC